VGFYQHAGKLNERGGILNGLLRNPIPQAASSQYCRAKNFSKAFLESHRYQTNDVIQFGERESWA
jgi:uncharacterized phosphosugar-binding protein